MLLTLLHLARPDCAFTVNASLMPNPSQGEERQPFELDYSTICSDYIGQKVCCSAAQNQQMSDSFEQIDIVFGSSNGGCDVCAVNLKRFWCAYTCSPNQSDFVQAFDYTQAMSYEKNEIVMVENISLTVESSTACRLFESCKRTSYATQISAMQSPAGFLNFQGENAVDSGKQIINLKFTNDPTKGLFIKDLDPCNLNISNPHRGFEVKANCSCNSCENLCSSTFKFKELSVMEGFDYGLVGGVWGAGVLLVLAVEWRRRRARELQEYSRFDTRDKR